MTLSEHPPKSTAPSPWEQDFQEMTDLSGLDNDGEEKEFIADGQINRPAYRNPFLNFPLILIATLGGFGTVAYMFFGNVISSPEAPKVAKPPTETTLDNTDQQRLAESEAKLAMGGSQKAFESHNKPTPTPTATTQPASAKPAVQPTPAPTARTIPAKPQIVYKTIVKTVPAPSKPALVIPKASPVAMVPIVAKAPPKSFIPIGGNVSRPTRPTRSPTVKTARAPLASENVLLSNTSNIRVKTDTLIPGTSVVGHLLSPMQSSSGSKQNSPGAISMKVALDQPLRTMGGLQIPAGAMVVFAATIDSQNGAIAAVSGDAWHQGKTISIPQGAISLQATNKQPLIASSFKPRMADLAKADTNNALLGAAGQVGDELTKSTASINVGSSSTIVQTTNNPNIWGAVLKGGFSTWATDQRQRTQTEASQIIATQSIQYLSQGTTVTLTVDSPAQVSIPQ
jgi:hypothetical protein